MKIAIKYLLICFLFVFTSCSSSDNTEPDLGSTYYQKFNVDGTQINDYTFTEHQYDYTQMARQLNDMLYVNIDYFDFSGTILYHFTLSFDKYGNFGQASISYQVWPSNFWYTSFVYDSAQHFHFEMEEYDVEKNTVKGNYSGKILLDPDDLNSASMTVEGLFYLKIRDNEGYPNMTALKLKMNGEDWRGTVLLDTGYFPYEGVHVGAVNQFLSDDKYKIVLGHKYDNGIGLHFFDDANTDFFAKLGKYNPATNQFDYYTTSQGTLNINTYGFLPPHGLGYFYSGTFNFTATNPIAPFDVITITDGIIYYHD